MLCKALEDYEAGAMAHLDEMEQASIIESIARRIADIDATIRALDGEQESAPAASTGAPPDR
jgi:hypothetical protein